MQLYSCGLLIIIHKICRMYMTIIKRKLRPEGKKEALKLSPSLLIIYIDSNGGCDAHL